MIDMEISVRLFLAFEKFKHLDCRDGDTCAGAEDGCNSRFVKEVIVLSGDNATGGHEDVFTSELLSSSITCGMSVL